MTEIVVELSTSLDGYATGPDDGPEHGLGVGGEPIHNWVLAGSSVDRKILDDLQARTGALIMGRRTFDVIDGPRGWSDTNDGDEPPIFVLTHEPPSTWRLGDRIRFVTDGLRSAADQARAAAGDKDVIVMGGADVCHAFLEAGLADVLNLHLSHVVLGAGNRFFPDGTKPFQLQLVDSVSTETAEHLSYHVISGAVASA